MFFYSRSSSPSLTPKAETKKVERRNDKGETPLHIAAIKGDANQARKLIKLGKHILLSFLY